MLIFYFFIFSFIVFVDFLYKNLVYRCSSIHAIIWCVRL